MVERETLLRRFCASDTERFHAYRSDAELAVYQGWSATSLEEARQFVSEMASVKTLITGGWIQLAIADATSNELIGDLGLYVEPDATIAEIGFTLCRSAHGHGHASRAVRQGLSLLFAASVVRVVRAVTDVRNTRSARVLERVGFAWFTDRQTVFKGEPCTEAVYVYHRTDAQSLHQAGVQKASPGPVPEVD